MAFSFRSWIDTAASLVMLAAGGAVLWSVFGRSAPAKSASVKVPSEPISIAASSQYGDAGALVVVVEYSDFQCPYCAAFAEATLPLLETTYIKPGRVRWAFVNFPVPSHVGADVAAAGADCAAQQGQFWPMHNLLFEKKGQVGRSEWSQIAETLKLDAKKLASCIADDATALKIRTGVADAKLLGVYGTPTFFVGTVRPDGRLQVRTVLTGAKSIDDFRSAIDPLLVSPR